MNGGVLHAIECLTASELTDAQSGYRFYGLDTVASLLSRAKTILETGDDLDSHEAQLNQQYEQIVPDDNLLVMRFQERLKSKPSEFAPLRKKDIS